MSRRLSRRFARHRDRRLSLSRRSRLLTFASWKAALSAQWVGRAGPLETALGLLLLLVSVLVAGALLAWLPELLLRP